MIPTPIKNYVKALEANDLALASKAWRAAQVPGKEEEKQAMIKEMDFSLVENFSLAQEVGDFTTMSTIWALAIYAPDARLSKLLLEVQSRHDPLAEEESPHQDSMILHSPIRHYSLPDNHHDSMEDSYYETPHADSTRYAKAHQFVKDILAKSPFSKPIESTIDRPGNYSVAGLLSFSNDSVRQKICDLKPTDVAALKALGNTILPQPGGRNSMKEWALKHHLTLNDSQIDRIHRASLMFQNQMVPNDAGNLAMAARIAQGKLDQGQPSPQNP